MKTQPVSNRLTLFPIEDERSKGGIIIPFESRIDNRGIVVDVGPDVDSWIKPDTIVLHDRFQAVENNDGLKFIKDNDVFAIVPDLDDVSTIQIPKDYVLILPDSYNNKVKLKSGLELYIDIDYEPEKHATVLGRVIKVPKELSEGSTKMELQEDDVVYFHYLAVNRAKKMGLAIETSDGNIYILVKYTSMFVALRRKSIEIASEKDNVKENFDVIPLNGNIIVESLPDDTPDKIGSIIVPDVAKKDHNDKYGVVKWVGSLVNGEKEIVAPGDRVLFEKDADIQMEYDMHRTLDSKYFRMKRENIMGIVRSE